MSHKRDFIWNHATTPVNDLMCSPNRALLLYRRGSRDGFNGEHHGHQETHPARNQTSYICIQSNTFFKTHSP